SSSTSSWPSSSAPGRASRARAAVVPGATTPPHRRLAHTGPGSIRAVGPRAYPGGLMSSLFDDLSLPAAFRRLDGVSVTPSAPDRPHQGGRLRVEAQPPPAETPYAEEPPYEEAPPYEEEPAYDEHPVERTVPQPPADLARIPHPADRPAPVRRSQQGTGDGPGLAELTDGLNPAQ